MKPPLLNVPFRSSGTNVRFMDELTRLVASVLGISFLSACKLRELTNGWRNLSVPLSQWMYIEGMGPKTRERYYHLIALLHRMRMHHLTNPERLRTLITPEDIVELVQSVAPFHDEESLFMLTLDTRNQPIRLIEVSRGCLWATVISPKVIARQSLMDNAYRVCLYHNHPSGSLEFSEQDVQVTHEVSDALRLVECELLDHIIVTSSDAVSLMNGGELDGQS